MTASESATENTAGATENTLPDQVASAALAHPSVVRLDGGETGTVASHLPGRQVVGVRLPETGHPVEVAVVLRLDRPLPEIVTELRERVRSVTGAVPVDITVSDVVVER